MNEPKVPTSSEAGDAALLRSVFSAYPDALLLVDFDGVIALANPAAAALLGYEAEQLKGLPVDALVPDAVRPRHAAYRAAYRSNPRPRPMGTQIDLVARRRDGTSVLVEIALSPLSDLPFVIAAIRDVGTYPRVRQALRRARYAEELAHLGRIGANSRDPADLIRALPVAVAAALDIDAVQLHLAVTNSSGIGLAAELGAVVDPLDGSGAAASGTLVEQVLAHSRPLVIDDFNGEAQATPPDVRDGSAPASAIAVPITDRHRTIGALSAYAASVGRFGADETRFLESVANLLATVLQRAQSEDALRHAQGLETIGQLTGGIAHDFNNLLTVISGNLQVLAELPIVVADDLAPQLVASGLRATSRGAELTTKLLAFSRRQVLQPTRIRLAEHLGSLAEMLRRTLDQRIRIELDIAADCPACVADAGQLESALLNIAINARDAMPLGGTLAFSARRCDHLPPAPSAELGVDQSDSTPRTYVQISVRDTGSGMSDAVKERAFEPFFTTKEVGRGTGLGLSTVYGFVRQSNGAVTIESAPGQGTTISLFLPASRVAQARSPAGTGAEFAPPPGLRVLVVEDEPDVRLIVQHFLAEWRCEVISCRDAEEALPLLESANPPLDLLLSDIVLGPGMRGTQLAAQGRRLRPGLATVLMSGYSPELLDEQEPGVAAPELLRKPFTRTELGAAITKALAAAVDR